MAQHRGRCPPEGKELDHTNCGEPAWAAACRHLVCDTTGLQQYRSRDGKVLVSTVAAVTTGPVAAWLGYLLPSVPCQEAQPCQSAATHTPIAPLMAEPLYAVAAALLTDGGERFAHHHALASTTGNIPGPQNNTPHP